MSTKILDTAAARRAIGHIGRFPAIAAAAAVALGASAASATVLDWSYTGPGPNSGGGTFDATLQSDGSYLLTGVSGTANGQAITGLDTFDGPDNLVAPPSPPNVGVDRNGISFDAGGVAYNLYEDFNGYDPGTEFACGAVYCLISSTSPTVAMTSFSVTLGGVPEPASWAMLIVGFGGIGAALRSRRQPVAFPA